MVERVAFPNHDANVKFNPSIRRAEYRRTRGAIQCPRQSVRYIADLSKTQAMLAGRGIGTVATLGDPSTVVATENNNFLAIEFVAELVQAFLLLREPRRCTWSLSVLP